MALDIGYNRVKTNSTKKQRLTAGNAALYFLCWRAVRLARLHLVSINALAFLTQRLLLVSLDTVIIVTADFSPQFKLKIFYHFFKNSQRYSSL